MIVPSKHVTGKATYTDDILEPKNLLHAAIGYSKISSGEIIEIDFTEVINSKGVYRYYYRKGY